ncbi:MAG: CPBP family intramembrane glutamic endopeptidase [Pseudomonadota bacterium]
MTIILFFAVLKLLKINNWQELGFTTNAKQFFIDAGKGIGFGVLIMLPVIAGLLLTENRVIDTGWEVTANNILSLFLTALFAGVLIALIEETLFRGAMLTAIDKYGSVFFAILASSFIYALVHFLQPSDDINSQVLNWGSGFALLKDALNPLIQVKFIFDSFIALFLAGALLAIVRLRRNRIAYCIGIHAGWVLAIKVFKRVTDSNAYSDYAFLTGSYDKVIGYLAAVCIAVFIIFLLKYMKNSN